MQGGWRPKADELRAVVADVRSWAKLTDAIDTKYVLALADDNDRLRAEVDEQCRVNGLGAERELALMGEVQRLRKELAAAADQRTRLEGACCRIQARLRPRRR